MIVKTRFQALAAGFVVALASMAAADDTVVGGELLKPYKQQLQAALKSGLQQGPSQAIDVCRVQAPAIAGSVSVDGVVVGRTSHRLRNPENVAPDWVEPVLADWVDTPASAQPLTVTLDGEREGYVEPIVMQPLCVTCHGEVIGPALKERIDALYPGDRPTGFSPGELRGVFWVEYTPASSAR